MSVTIRPDERSAVAIEVDGAIVAFAPTLTAAIGLALARPGVVDVVVDVSRLRYLPSQSIGELVTGHNTTTAGGIAFTVVGASGTTRRVLGVTGLLGALGVEDTARADPTCGNCDGTGWLYEGAELLGDSCTCVVSPAAEPAAPAAPRLRPGEDGQVEVSPA